MLPIPSESVSILSLASKGNASSSSKTPSLSSSGSEDIPSEIHTLSQLSGMPSPSESGRPLRLIRGYSSDSSDTPSPSSSVSALLPIPSESVSILSVASKGNTSFGDVKENTLMYPLTSPPLVPQAPVAITEPSELTDV